VASDRITRRSFVSVAAAMAAAFTIVPRHVLGGPAIKPPSEKLNIAGIGLGGMGPGNLSQMETENIVALCDVDQQNAARTFKKYPGAKTWSDYREMFDKQKDIDAVLVATPDHTHAVISMAAIKLGKHVYCQKPLTHDVYEARMLAKAAAEAKVVTQMGIQGHSGEGARLVSEWIAAGLIGEVREVDVWCSLSYYPWGHEWWSSRFGAARPTDTPPVPATLNWDMWLGPAPERPYHPAYHPAVWRCWRDYGNGMMGDRGAHSIDPIYWALKLGAPNSVAATSMGSNADTYQLAAIVTYQFPARGQMPPVKLTWYEGLCPPRPDDLEDGRRLPGEGGAIVKGDKAKIIYGVYGDSPRIFPESKMKEAKLPPKSIPRIGGSHEQDWIRAAKSGRPAGADFSYSGPLTEVCCLGNVAIRVDKRIDWDAENMKITNNADANKYIRAEYRKGWSL